MQACQTDSVIVSVVIPAYNSAKWIGTAIESTLAQTHRPGEVIVVDDGSTDDTAEIVRRYPVTLIRQANQRTAAARNTGIRAAKGDVIALLDADDAWYPTKTQKQLELLTDGVVAVGSLMHYANADNRIFGVSGEDAEARQSEIGTAEFMPFAPSSMLFRRETIEAIGGFDEELGRIAAVEDLDALSKMARHGRVVTLMKPLGIYRIHTQAQSAQSFWQMQDATRFLQARLRNEKLSWPQFKASHPPTLRERRRDLVHYLYRTGGMHIATDQTFRGCMEVALAGSVGPCYTVKRLKQQRRAIR